MTAYQTEILDSLSSLAATQREQLEISRQALLLASSHETARREEVQKLWEDWKTESRELTAKALLRYRRLARLYGGMMVLLGALLAVSWINVFRA